MHNLLTLSLYTIRDQTRHKSFYVLLGISIFFVLLIRSCYGGNYTVQGRQVDTVTVAWHASKIAFQLIGGGMLFLVTMLTMGTFSRDRQDGSLVMFLSRAVTRWQYVFGRVLGTWILSTVFMFILHCTIFLTAWSKTGGMIPGYLTASLVCSINLLFTILVVSLLSLFLPDFIAAAATIIIVVVGFISDGIYQVMQNAMVQQAMQQNDMVVETSWWRLMYPKMALLQQYAVSIIDKSEFQGMGPVHPFLNVLIYSLVAAGILIWSFNRREI